MKSQWIEHKGQKIFHIDVSNFEMDAEGVRAELEAAVSVVVKEAKGSVLLLADLRGTTMGSDVTGAMRANAPKMKPYFRKAALVVQVSKMRKVILDTLTLIIGFMPKRFDDFEKAKDWLASAAPQSDSSSKS